MGASELVYKDELFGDKSRTIYLCSLYVKHFLVEQREKGVVKYKKEPISDKNIRQHLKLLSNDPDFKYFN